MKGLIQRTISAPVRHHLTYFVTIVSVTGDPSEIRNHTVAVRLLVDKKTPAWQGKDLRVYE